MEEQTVNQEAIRLLDEAAFTSSLIKNKERKTGEIDGKHLYPTTREDALKMKDLLAQALAAAEEPENAEFKEKYDKLKEVVDWSLSKHRTWVWGVIGGAALIVALLAWGVVSNNKDVSEYKAKLKVIKAWTPSDTTITWESCVVDNTSVVDTTYYLSAVNWKTSKLKDYKRYYTSAAEEAENYRQKADTASSDERLKSYQHWEKYYTERAEKFRGEFDELAASDFDGVKKHAIKTAKGWISSSRVAAGALIFLVLLMGAFIWLYIWTGNPYGYEITNSRVRNKILTWIRKIGFWLAGICFGTGLVAQLFADDNLVEYVYSSGRREVRREADVAGTAMNVMWKIFLLVAGVIIFIGISMFIMIMEGLFCLPAKLREIKAEKA